MHDASPEVQRVAERYARRATAGADARYSMLDPSVWQAVQERQRVLLSLLAQHADRPLNQLRLLEIGCGAGGNLLELLRLGFVAENLVGNELLPERFALARRNLPSATALVAGDAMDLEFEDASFDIVFQSTVFTSLLDDAFQSRLASRMWRWVRPGGGVLWYDFVYDNPKNPDVRGVPLRRVRALFPAGQLVAWRVTLAPPISRRACRIHPVMYHVFNALPLLRTHVLGFIKKS